MGNVECCDPGVLARIPRIPTVACVCPHYLSCKKHDGALQTVYPFPFARHAGSLFVFWFGGAPAGELVRPHEALFQFGVLRSEVGFFDFRDGVRSEFGKEGGVPGGSVKVVEPEPPRERRGRGARGAGCRAAGRHFLTAKKP